ncbi:MAG TPA: L-seryl-tRNA(Sec) selenium transferase [Ktedonobacterales bacterium]|jgi:L-seryl-tRNA(Ser) seleniumtransferase|nr:L-seryl-tRNA(Sec) selenium transferase [Ktedonobacterales bacterium]
MSREPASLTNQAIAQALRALPSVDALCNALAERLGAHGHHLLSHAQQSHAARATLQIARTAILAEQPVDSSLDALVSEASSFLIGSMQPVPRPVINATGVILNTNLGRAPLSDAALAAIAAVAAGYSALEYDLEPGERGSRLTAVRSLLRDVTGAEDALVVNNNAAAMLITLSGLANGQDVIISRGELVEIGGGFRIPDVLRQSGARLVEVGTTNRTRVADFAAAITSETALLLSVHPSNYRILGFTASPTVAELAHLAHQREIPLIHDLGSGALLRTEQWGLLHEPMPQNSIASGADLVCFSGDKLLGGPQAGIIVGKSALITQLERHPLMRAMRIDKLTLAALHATLQAYQIGTAEREIPVWRMIASPPEAMKVRAEQWANSLRQAGIVADVREGFSTIGGGSMPGETLPTWHCAVAPNPNNLSLDEVAGDAASALSARLRGGQPPVVARVLRDRVLLDPRTVLPEQDATLLQAMRDAFAS